MNTLAVKSKNIFSPNKGVKKKFIIGIIMVLLAVMSSLCFSLNAKADEDEDYKAMLEESIANNPIDGDYLPGINNVENQKAINELNDTDLNERNGNTLGQVLGFSRENLITWLNTKYLGYYDGTPYEGATTTNFPKNPVGDLSAWGVSPRNYACANCSGFVWHGLVGAHIQAGGSPNPYSVPNWAADSTSGGGWVKFINNNGIDRYQYGNIADALNSGNLEKGDVVWARVSSGWDVTGAEDHVLFYWGDYPGQNRFMHCCPSTGCICITEFMSKGSVGSVHIIKTAQKGGVIMNKRSTCSWSENNPNYSYRNGSCVYSIYKDQACTQWTGVNMTVDSNGDAKTDVNALPIGTYYVREDQNQHGNNYLWNSEVGSVYVNSNTYNWVKWPGSGTGTTYDTPVDDPDTIEVGKCDQQTGETEIPEGYADFSNAHYEFKYYYNSFQKESDEPSECVRHWVMKTNQYGQTTLRFGDKFKVSGDDFFTWPDGEIAIPVGTYVVREVKAPEGYELSDNVYIMNVVKDESVAWGAITKAYFGHDCDTWEKDASGKKIIVHHNAGDEITRDIIPDPHTGKPELRALEQVKKGDYKFVKEDFNTQNPMPYIPWKLTSKTTGEWHVIVTDQNGEFNSNSEKCPHTENTNYFDNLLDSEGKVPVSGIDQSRIESFYEDGSSTGVWFCKDASSGQYVPPTEAENELGALPFDDYYLEELPVKSNEGYNLVSRLISITLPNYTVDGGTITNITPAPKRIGTYATGYNSESKELYVDNNETIVDQVSYFGLDKGKKYKLVGTLMDRGTGKLLKDGLGRNITSEKEFIANQSDGYEDIYFDLNTIGLQNKEIVVFEKLFDEDGEQVASHEELGDLSQTVHVTSTSLHTTLEDAEGNKVIHRSHNTRLIDYITYTGLTPNKEYNLKGKIINKATGDVVAESEKYFVPKESDFNETLEFHFDSSHIDKDTELVCYEYLYKEKDFIAKHEDINDANQTVTVIVPIMHIATTATSINNDKDIQVGTDETIIDRVNYSNAEIGFAYKLVGTLMDKTTGLPLKDSSGNVITSEKEFIAKTDTGYEDMEFYLNTQNLIGKQIVVFEKMYDDQDILIAAHEDITDRYQTVNVVTPKMKTVLVDNEGKKLIAQSEDTILRDTVSYSGLNTDAEYLLEGQIINKATGNVEADASQIFIAEGKSGSTVMEFHFDSTKILNDVDLVCFETLKQGNKIIAEHKDINDKDQSVKVKKAEISTFLHENGSYAQTIKREYKCHLTDQVSYTGLAKGQSYLLIAKLMDKATGNPFIDCSGKQIETKLDFVAKDINGTVDVPFEIDTSSLSENTKIVCYEYLYVNGNEIAKHEDINDANQTVTVIVPTMNIGTTARGGHTANNDIYAIENETIIDRVTYEGCEPGFNYKMVGILMDKTTGLPLKDSSGNVITAEKEFMTQEVKGDVELTFNIDARLLQDKQIVVFEKMYDHTGIIRATHEDIEDHYQTVHVLKPNFVTELTEKETGNHEIQRYENQVLIESVSYENLCPGETYSLDGYLYDQSTQEPYINEVTGETVNAQGTFTPKESKGSASINYVFDSTLMPANLVVTSITTLSQAGQKLMEDEPSEAESVTITSPVVNTNASAQDGNKYFIAQHDSVTYDVLNYQDLPLYRNITGYSWFVYEDTGLPVTDGLIESNKAQLAINDLVVALGGTYEAEKDASDASSTGRWIVVFDELTNKVDNEKLAKVDFETLKHVMFDKEEFTPQTRAESNTLTFKFDSAATQAGKAVAMTVLQSENTRIGSHVDINDLAEEIEILRSNIFTNLADSEGNKVLEPTGNVMLVDHVEYSTVIVGKQYILHGQIINKATGEVIAESEVKLTPETSNGEVDVVFEVDLSKYAGCDLVAYETFTLEGTQAAAHTDINDENQTVHVNNILPGGGASSLTQTGNGLWMLVLLLVLLASITGGYYIYNKKKFTMLKK